MQRSWCEPVGLRSTCGQSSCNWLWAICVGVMALTGVMSSKRNGHDCGARMKWEIGPWLAEGAPTGQRRGYSQCELPPTYIITSRGSIGQRRRQSLKGRSYLKSGRVRVSNHRCLHQIRANPFYSQLYRAASVLGIRLPPDEFSNLLIFQH